MRPEVEEKALLAAWQPYVEYLQSCIEKLEEVQTVYRTALAEKQAGGWDALCAAAKGWKQPVLRGKKYEALRDAFPDIRKTFEKSRDEAKKIFTDARDRYLAETEASVLEDIRACSATVRRYVDLTTASSTHCRRPRRSAMSSISATSSTSRSPCSAATRRRLLELLRQISAASGARHCARMRRRTCARSTPSSWSTSTKIRMASRRPS